MSLPGQKTRGKLPIRNECSGGFRHSHGSAGPDNSPRIGIKICLPGLFSDGVPIGAILDRVEDYPPHSETTGLETPPCDRDAEDGLLATILIEPDRLSDIPNLQPGDFFFSNNKIIFRAIKILENEGIAIDNITVADQLEKGGHLSEVGGAGYIAGLLQCANGFNAIEYARIIKEEALRRAALALAPEIAKLARSKDFHRDLGFLRDRLEKLQNTELNELKDNVNQPNSKRKSRWSVAELLDTEFAEPKWAIPDLIPEGLTLIGGRPKVGKSWFLLQAAIAVGCGGRFFGKQVEQGRVLYVAFEDSPKRLQDRIRKMGMPRDALVTFERKWKPLHEGGIDDLVAELAAVDYRLVIFDTLTRSFPGLSQKDHPESIGECVDQIQSLAINHNFSFTFSDHTRKPMGRDNDPIDDILYSSEKVKSADVVLALYKEQGKSGAKLLGRGRDIEDVDLALQWDPEIWCWQSLGDSGQIKTAEHTEEVLSALASFGKARMIDIARATGINKGTVYKILSNLWMNQKVHKEEIGNDVFYEVKQP